MISLSTKDNQIAVTVMGQFTLADYQGPIIRNSNRR